VKETGWVHGVGLVWYRLVSYLLSTKLPLKLTTNLPPTLPSCLAPIAPSSTAALLMPTDPSPADNSLDPGPT